MGEIKVSPDYNWFRSTVPLKKVCSAVLSLHATSLLVLCSSRLALDNAEQLWQCLSSQTVSSHVLGVHESTLTFHVLLALPQQLAVAALQLVLFFNLGSSLGCRMVLAEEARTTLLLSTS